MIMRFANIGVVFCMAVGCSAFPQKETVDESQNTGNNTHYELMYSIIEDIEINQKKVWRLELHRQELSSQLSILSKKVSESEIKKIDSDKRNIIINKLKEQISDRIVLPYAAYALGNFGGLAKEALPSLLSVLEVLQREEVVNLRESNSFMGLNAITIVRESIRKIDPKSLPPCPSQFPADICNVSE